MLRVWLASSEKKKKCGQTERNMKNKSGHIDMD